MKLNAGKKFDEFMVKYIKKCIYDQTNPNQFRAAISHGISSKYLHDVDKKLSNDNIIKLC